MTLTVASLIGDYALIAVSTEKPYCSDKIIVSKDFSVAGFHDISNDFSNSSLSAMSINSLYEDIVFLLSSSNFKIEQFITLVKDDTLPVGFELSLHTVNNSTKTHSIKSIINDGSLFITPNDFTQENLTIGFNYYLDNMNHVNQKNIINLLKNIYSVCSRVSDSVESGFQLLLMNKFKPTIFKFIEN